MEKLFTAHSQYSILNTLFTSTFNTIHPSYIWDNIKLLRPIHYYVLPFWFLFNCQCYIWTNEDHLLMYHAHLDNLLEKHFAFRVKFQPYYKQASIVKLTQDPEVMRTTEDAITPTIVCILTLLCIINFVVSISYVHQMITNLYYLCLRLACCKHLHQLSNY